MPKALLYIIFILIAITGNQICYAQQSKKPAKETYDFVPRETVVFEDDFSRDTFWTDSLHKTLKWKIMTMPNFNTSEDNSNEEPCNVEKDNYGYYVNIIDGAEPLLEANIKKNILGNSFTIECDFLPEKLQSSIEVELMKAGAPFATGCSINGKGEVLTMRPNWKAGKPKTKYPGTFALNVWHHFAVAYKNETAKYYIDHHQVMIIDSTDLSNSSLALAPKGPMKIRNVRIAVGDPVKTFDKLLTEKKFITHAINFDVNKSTIKPESLDFIRQLAQFLKANPSVKLEIDGHTDDDGEASANMKLSQERANEVKKQLIVNGIIANRLTTKGYGASKLLQPNTTAESKTNNRRVEFIKLN